MKVSLRSLPWWAVILACCRILKRNKACFISTDWKVCFNYTQDFHSNLQVSHPDTKTEEDVLSYCQLFIVFLEKNHSKELKFF